MPASSRDLRLDFFRGLALIFIFVDHIPENIFSYFTIQAIQPFDAAEVFIFISGYTAALVYGRTLVTQGPLYATARILSRAWQLYVAHIFLFVIFIAEVSYTVTTFNNPMYNDEMRVGDFLEEPHVAIIKALLLQFQPTFLDILPLYILLLVIFPVILLGLRIAAALVLILRSSCISSCRSPTFRFPLIRRGTSGTSTLSPGSFCSLPELRSVFLGGMTGNFRVGTGALPSAILIVGAGLVVKLSWTIHGVWDPFPVSFSRILAGEQEQLLADPGHPLLRTVASLPSSYPLIRPFCVPWQRNRWFYAVNNRWRSSAWASCCRRWDISFSPNTI